MQVFMPAAATAASSTAQSHRILPQNLPYLKLTQRFAVIRTCRSKVFDSQAIFAGCSKTTLARAAATASKASLFPLSGAQLYSMYVGEGEALLRGTFKMARQAAPSIIFLDEVDSLAGQSTALRHPCM